MIKHTIKSFTGQMVYSYIHQEGTFVMLPYDIELALQSGAFEDVITEHEVKEPELDQPNETCPTCGQEITHD